MLSRCVCVIAAMALAACAGPVGHGSGPQPEGAGWRTMPVGLCEDYPEETRSIEAAARDLAVLDQHGIRSLRISIGWDGVESADSVYDWAFWDWFIPAAVEGHGIALLPYICYTPAWAASEGEGETYTRPPRDPAAFAAFVGEAARRYGRWIDSWELWNEPDNRQYWTGTPEQFADLVRAGAAAAQREDPGAVTVLGGIAWDLGYLADVLDAGAAPAVDVVNLHSYLETWHEGPAELLLDSVADAAAVVRDHGEGEPLWMAEVGYSTFRGPGGAVSGQYRAREAYEHTEAYQAAHLLKTVAMLAQTGLIERVAWYELRDLPPGEQVIGDVNNRHLGVLRADGSPKPALDAVVFADRLFSRPFRPAGALSRRSGPVRTSAFERPDGTVFLVAWVPVGGAEGRLIVEPAAEVRSVYDERGRELPADASREITIPAGAARVVFVSRP